MSPSRPSAPAATGTARRLGVLLASGALTAAGLLALGEVRPSDADVLDAPAQSSSANAVLRDLLFEGPTGTS